MFAKLKYLSSKLADFVRATQSFFATNEYLWHMLKSHWLSKLVGPVFLVGATFGAIDAFKNYRKAGNKNFDKIFALVSLCAFQLTLLMGIVITPIANVFGITGVFFYTPAWVVIALTLNTVYLLSQSLNHLLRGLSHKDPLERQDNLSMSLVYLQKGLAAGLMSMVLAIVQVSGVSTFFVPALAFASAMASTVCFGYDFFQSKIEASKKTDTSPAEPVIETPKVINPFISSKSLFAHANRKFHIRNASDKECKSYLIEEIQKKTIELRKQAAAVKREQKIILLNQLLTCLESNQTPFSKRDVLDMYPQAFQSISIFTGKSDIEDIYDACLFYSQKYSQSLPLNIEIDEWAVSKP